MHPSSDSTPLPRVLVIGSHCFPDALEWHVVDSLRHLGCPVELFETRSVFNGVPSVAGKILGKAADLLLREPERLIERRLLRTVARFEPGLILVILGNQLSPKTVSLLRSCTQAPLVCWCQDQMTTLGRQFLLGAGYDIVFLKDRYMQDLFSRMVKSTQFVYLPEACNPRVHRAIELTPQDREVYGCDVMLAGSLYYYRQEILRQLQDFDVKLWGYVPDWLVYQLRHRHTGRDVYADDKARAARAARIALNTLHYAEVNSLNCRAFELAGCGAFQLTTWVPALAEHFEPETEIATFSTVDEMVEKVRHYLANPQHAHEIARRGQLRAYRDHTYELRLGTILSKSLGRAPVATAMAASHPVASAARNVS